MSSFDHYERERNVEEYQRMRRAVQEGTTIEPNHQGKQRVRGAFPNAVVTKEKDNETNSDPWYDITMKYKYHLGEENLYEPDKTTLVAPVKVPHELKDDIEFKMSPTERHLGGARKSRRRKRGSRTSRRRSRRARK